VVAALPLSVSNSGDRTLDNTTLTFRFHDLFRREVLENLSFVPVGSVQATKIQRSFSKSGSLQYSSYLLSEINPGETIMVNEPLYLHATSFSVPVDARTADDIPVRFSANVEVALEFEVSLAARDLFSRDYRLSLETAEATSLDDLSERVATRRVRTRMADARAKATFGQYLRALAFGIDEDRIFVVFSELEEHAAGDGRLWFARPEPRVRQVSYKPVAWSLLFQ
jgi:hypothetical protein